MEIINSFKLIFERSGFAAIDWKTVVMYVIVGILFYATIGFRLLPNHDTSDDGSVFDDAKDFSQVPRWKKTLSLVLAMALPV